MTASRFNPILPLDPEPCGRGWLTGPDTRISAVLGWAVRGGAGVAALSGAPGGVRSGPGPIGPAYGTGVTGWLTFTGAGARSSGRLTTPGVASWGSFLSPRLCISSSILPALIAAIMT